MAGVWFPTSCCQFWVFWVPWLGSQESVRSEPETPNTVEANDARVNAPVHVLETTHLTWGSTSPSAWRWSSRVWGSLLSSPFLLVITGKYSVSLTQDSNILHHSHSQMGCHRKPRWPCVPHGSPGVTTGKVVFSLNQEMLHVAALTGAPWNIYWAQTHSFSLGYV